VALAARNASDAMVAPTMVSGKVCALSELRVWSGRSVLGSCIWLKSNFNLREACEYGNEPAGSGATELVS
jgi:hypothetical protein